MSENHSRENRSGIAVVGFAFHVVMGTAGTFILAALIRRTIGFLTERHLKDADFVLPIVVSGAVLGLSVAPRLAGRVAPFVGLIGVAALVAGVHDFWRGWGTWSHQSRIDYVLSQLFCVGSGCGDSDGLGALFYGWPFLCLTSYSLGSLAALITLRIARPQVSH